MSACNIQGSPYITSKCGSKCAFHTACGYNYDPLHCAYFCWNDYHIHVVLPAPHKTVAFH